MSPVAHPRVRQPFMYLSYVDDSGSTGDNLTDKQALFQVVGGPIISEQAYPATELLVSSWVEDFIPEDQWESFEFHACDMFHGNAPFKDLGQEKCHGLLQRALEWIRNSKIPVLYGAVDKTELDKQIYRTAQPLDIAFNLYLESLDKWFEKKIDEVVESFGKKGPTPAELDKLPMGILIADDSGSRKDIRRTLELTYRRHRKRLPTRADDDHFMTLWDDLYFGNSAHSLGIQLADICVYFISLLIPMKVVSDSDLIPVTCSDAMPVVFRSEATLAQL